MDYEILTVFALFLVGAVMGSYGCCQVWRLKVKTMRGAKRSKCMQCGKELKWYELIPVVSWFAQRGKCRKCGSFIGWQEIVSELGMGLFFVVSYYAWPERMGGASESIWNWLGFSAFLLMSVGLMICFVYDLRWQRLPMTPLIFSLICAIMMVLFVRMGGFFVDLNFWGVALSLVLLPGLYFALYKVSAEKWVGGGDWILALVCAVALSDWLLSLLCLLASNLVGCLVAIPLVVKHKKSEKMKLAMGPLLIIGFVIVFFWGDVMRAGLGI